MDPNCPSCGQKMNKDKKYNTYKCENKSCTDKFIAVPKSIFGITEEKPPNG